MTYFFLQMLGGIFLQSAAAPSEWILFFGRFHPLVVHLPIGFLLVAGLLEISRLLRGTSVTEETIAVILFWSAVGATVACVFGYMLSLGGGYDADMLQSHKWEGIGVAVFAWISWAVKSGSVSRLLPLVKRAYPVTFGIAILLLMSAGHKGGNLTHGSDYLVQYLPSPVRKLAGLPPKVETAKIQPITDINKAMVYQQIVSPILQNRCIQCHNADKSKGNLRLDTPEMILKGAESGPVLVSGQGAGSQLVKVCLLPDEDDLHMPPKGKPQLTQNEIALLTWWIDQQASFDKSVADLKVSDEIRPVLASFAAGGAGDTSNGHSASTKKSAESPVLTMEMKPADPAALEELTKIGLLVSPVSDRKNQLQISGLNFLEFTDKHAPILTKAASQIVWLNLGGTAISDAGLKEIGKLPNLQKIHLENTKITDAGLKELRNLSHLQYLNLYGTGITDTGIAELKNLKSLKSVFLWQTKVSVEGVADLQKAIPGLEVDLGWNHVKLAAGTSAGGGETK